MPEPDLRFPIGKFHKDDSPSRENNHRHIAEIEAAPAQFRKAIAGLTPAQLDTPYRPDGWTVRQLIHHVADSHMNAYNRVRLGLTEDWPTIFAYKEDRWAELADARTEAVSTSLDLLQSLHVRWVRLFSSLNEQDWKRGFLHPAMGRQSVEQSVMLYDWHGRHHTAHVTQLSQRMGW